MTVPATTWFVAHPRAGDGDNVWAYLTREEWIGGGFAHTVYSSKQAPDGTPLPATASLRLVTLDAPERGDPGYREAGADVRLWLAEHPGPLMADTYETAGFDRLLADIYPEGDRASTLSQHMLRIGWDPWIPPSARNARRD